MVGAFAVEWNGVSLMSTVVRDHFRCLRGMGMRWFQLEWIPRGRDKPIALKEYPPIVIACVILGSKWRGQTAAVKSDNTAAVVVINSRSGHVPKMMHLLRCLFVFEARYNCRAEPSRIPGKMERFSGGHITKPCLYTRYRQRSRFPFGSRLSCWRSWRSARLDVS